MAINTSRNKVILGVLLVGVLGTYVACTHVERTWYLGMLPDEIEVESIVKIGGISDTREGCGAAVFRITEAAAAKVQTAGLGALAAARKARAHDENYHAYSEWRSTPYVETGDGLTLEDRWLTGLGCAGLSSDLSRSINKALNERGAYYSTSHEAGLILIPAIRLAVFSYSG